jgi:hypothetical protein
MAGAGGGDGDPRMEEAERAAGDHGGDPFPDVEQSYFSAKVLRMRLKVGRSALKFFSGAIKTR